MQLKNCRWCGKVFAHPVDVVCPDCRQQEEEEFETVYQYLKKRRNATIDEVHEETGVDKRRIVKFIRQGRLMSDSGKPFDIFVNCESCGDPIREGRYCNRCTKTLQEEVEGLDPQEEPPPRRRREDRMHTADRRLKDDK